MVFWRTNPHQTQSKNINRKDDKIMGATKKQLAIQKRIREMTNGITLHQDRNAEKQNPDT